MNPLAIATLFITLLMGNACSGTIDRGTAWTSQESIDSLWQKEFKTAQELVDNFTTIEKQLAEKDSCGRLSTLFFDFFNLFLIYLYFFLSLFFVTDITISN